ncbi:MAG: hypothetical protein GF375_01260, partial [Candidatus Omnitrophica bacterium]|nr:hypothetical protein [Candidatus Omnitrophota bacterium]MBD3268758.1 hypothetical protein [Candidatus Omnitrophota bacterium]
MAKLKNIKINEKNQLTAKASYSNKPLKINGSFNTDSQNNLIFTIDEPLSWRKVYDLPKRIKFRGSWNIDKDHNLLLQARKTKDYPKSTLTLSGKIQNIDSDYLTLKLYKKSFLKTPRYHSIKLKGKWCSDKFNRLNFEVSRKDNPGTLRFKNAWKINENQQLTYTYKKTRLLTKSKIDESITFFGFWEIMTKNRLVYKLNNSRHSGIDFRAHLQTPNVYPKKGAIKYRVGVGLKYKPAEFRKRTLTLYGQWKFSRKLGLYFEMDYGKRIRRISFSSKVNLTPKDNVIFTLLDSRKKPLGIKVRFQKKILNQKDIEFFARFSKKGKDFTAG